MPRWSGIIPGGLPDLVRRLGLSAPPNAQLNFEILNTVIPTVALQLETVIGNRDNTMRTSFLQATRARAANAAETVALANLGRGFWRIHFICAYGSDFNSALGLTDGNARINYQNPTGSNVPLIVFWARADSRSQVLEATISLLLEDDGHLLQVQVDAAPVGNIQILFASIIATKLV